MKTKLLIATLFITNMFIAQNTIGFETLTVPSIGYYNGQDDYTAGGNEQEIIYEDDIANFFIYATDYGSFFYAHGFVYSNQTDLTTADYTNYSAFAQTAGGSNGSSNYAIVYAGGIEKVTFDNEIMLMSVDITNSVWAYRYMDGSDGTLHDYETGDYLKLTITGVKNDNTLTTPIDFYLADFTNGNSTIINDWSNVDLSSLGAVKGLNFGLTTNDSYTPLYFCLDDLVYTSVASADDNKFVNTIKLYPNPTSDFFTIRNVKNAVITMNDTNGRVVLKEENYSSNTKINLQNINKGIYFVKITSDNKTAIKKLIIK